VADLGKKRNTYMVVIEKSEGKQLFGRSRHRWEDNITIDQDRGHQMGLSGSG
jgi:hypothetical protein